jgi:hypothetical protein
MTNLSLMAKRPILVKQADGGISHIHLPGDFDYGAALAKVETVAGDLRLSFEQAASHLGYELGYTVEHFGV